MNTLTVWNGRKIKRGCGFSESDTLSPFAFIFVPANEPPAESVPFLRMSNFLTMS